MADNTLEFSESDLAQMQRFNRKLAWLPRFRIRNRLTPRLIQALLRFSQIVGTDKPLKYDLLAQNTVVYSQGTSVPVRIIRPQGKAQGVVLDYHGGGWVIGNAQMNDDLNIAMVKACNVAVVSVDYRLAINTPIEDLMQDCLCAARWLLSDDCTEFVGLPVIVVGESAGAHLAVATLLSLKQSADLLQRVSGALLYYGVYDLAGTPSVHSAAAETLVLDGPGMAEALGLLTPGLSDDERRRAPLSPLYGDLSGLPPALMFTGELDPLRDDTLELAQRWQQSAPAEVHLLPSSAHGFIHFPTIMASRVLAYSRAWLSRQIEAKTSS
ncbi:hypothetical protein PMI25_003046 [Pseudomonas sp. GM30]|nr:hypothetical protein PMI25_003046 [Pseudomonas sp. GM30]